MNLISIEDFKKIDLRVAKVLSAEKVEGSEKLLKLMVDVGEGEEMLEDGSTPRLDSGQASSHLRPSEVLSSESRTGSRKTRQILSGIAKSYAPKDLVGKNIIVITNLEPRIMMGMESQGMVLAVLDSEGKAVLISPEREVSSGTTVS